MRKILKNTSLTTPITLNDVGKTLVAGAEFEIPLVEMDNYLSSNDTLLAIRSGNIIVGDGYTFYTNALESECYFKTAFADDAYVIEGSGMRLYTPVIVQDPYTGVKCCAPFMNILTMMREFYNASDNPVYLPGFQPLLGPNGEIQDLENKTTNLEEIHSDSGWHEQEVKRALFIGPDNLLIYYGWLNSFNYGVNAWTNEKVAQDMAKYNLIVLGDGVQDPNHGDFSNTSVIIPRIKALNPSAKIFGYVSTTEDNTNGDSTSLSDFQLKVSQWNDLEVHGIFLDEAGYDFGTNRVDFNSKVSYVHNQEYANICFVNSWNMDHIIGTENDESYPNETWNPTLTESDLQSTDYYLLESFPINTSAYSGTGGYESKSDWAIRGVKAINHRYTYGIKLVACGMINNDNTNGQQLFNFGYVSALMFSLEGFGTSDTNYGASSAAVNFWYRHNAIDLLAWSLSPSVQVDISDGDVYWRYTDKGKLKLDFSDGAQQSEIVYFSEAGKQTECISMFNTITLTNTPAGDREAGNVDTYRLFLDLTGFSQFRCTLRVQTAGYSGCDIRLQGSLNDSSFSNLDGSNGPEIAIDSTGLKDSGWVTLNPVFRRENVSIRLVAKDGNGTVDPIIRQVILMFRP